MRQPKWVIHRRHSDDSIRAQLSSDFSDLVKQVLSARNLTNAQEVNHDLSDLLAFNLIAGIDQAAQLLADAISNQQRILVVGDYDADGATATALAVSALAKMGARVEFYSTRRLDEGYGLSLELALRLTQEFDFEVLMTVDLGISALSGVAQLKQQGYRVVITDHHLPAAELPPADAIVNPNLPICQFPSKNLPGVGVAFYVIAALRQALYDRGWFIQQQLERPNLACYLDLVALGVVADVMPFDRNNRIIVKRGLELMRSPQRRPFLQALLQQLNMHPQLLDCQDLSFQIIPRLNSVGRMGDMRLGVAWLLSETLTEAHECYKKISQMNQKRRLIERKAYQQAIESIQSLQLDQQQALVVYGPWHIGVIGILAGKLKDSYQKVTVIFAEDGDHLKGSARSIKAINLHHVLLDIEKDHAGLMVNFGGHEMAAGITIKRQDFACFREAFLDSINQQLAKTDSLYVIETDGQLQPQDFSLEVVRELRLIPWGNAFPAPQFDGIYEIIWLRVSGAHLHFRVRLENQRHAECIAFNQAPKIQLQVGTRVHLVYELRESHYTGLPKLQILVNHLRVVD